MLRTWIFQCSISATTNGARSGYASTCTHTVCAVLSVPQGDFGARVKQARFFGLTQCSHVTMCQHGQTAYTLYTGTLFAKKQLRPAQVILLLRGICKGESTVTVIAPICVAS